MDERSGSLSVLHVDDDPVFTERAATVLEREDERIRVETASSVREGLDRLAQREFDCVVSAYDVPDTDGLELLEAVRETCPDVPFILLTGAGSEAVASEAISAGVTDYVEKRGGADQFAALANRITNAVEQYRSRRELEASQKRLSLFVDQSPLGVVEWDEAFDVVRANGAAEDILGYASEELSGRSWKAIVPDADRDAVGEVVSDLLSDEGGYHSINENVRKDGEHVVCEWHNRVVTDEEGSVVAIFSQFQDVTDRERRRYQIEQIQQRTRELMRTRDRRATAQVAVETAHEVLGAELSGVHLLSADGKRLEPVACAETVEETLDGEPTYERTARDDPVSTVVWETFEGGEPFVVDDTRVADRLADETPTRSGIVHPLADHGVFVVSSTEPDAFDGTDEAIVEILAASLTAALDRVDREVRLRERERELAAERDRLSALFEMVPEPVTHVQFRDGEPILRDVNGAFEETFGYDAETAVGRSNNDLIVPPDRRDEADEIDEQARVDGAVKREVRRRTADGLGDFLFRSVPIGDSSETDEYFGIYVDVSEQKSYERQLERKNERLDEFANIVSHDLRNPLNVAQGRVELLGRDHDGDHLDAIERAHDRIEALIDDILTLARQGETAVELERVDLAETVQGCWGTVETGDATLVVESERAITADRRRLKQLLENLFRNAVEHGGPDVTVRVGDLTDGFFVADDGVGIPEDERDTVFETGYSTNRDGTGFGLDIVQRTADAHGWTVRVTEGSDGGARFEVTGVEAASA